MAADLETLPTAASDTAGIVKLAVERQFDLVVVGPEDPLIAGLADSLREAGIAAYGPPAAAARLEGSKAFSKGVMHRYGVPTAASETFTDPVAAGEYARACYGSGGQLAVKASGAALGRGVAVCDELDAALDAIERTMVRRQYGIAGETVVLEERLIGREFSLLTIIGDSNYASLPVAQDYKRVYDNDQGPNTGGMGSYSPCGISDGMVAEVERTMVDPIIRFLSDSGLSFRGTLFTGVMVTDAGPKCLEYNVRFGDPETQTVMRRLESGLAETMHATALGRGVSLPRTRPEAAVTVIVGSKGYPLEYAKGLPVSIGALPPAVKLFFAGVAGKPEALVTSGGRVVAVSATGETVQEARKLAYEGAKAVHFEGSMYRTDIASE